MGARSEFLCGSNARRHLHTASSAAPFDRDRQDALVSRFEGFPSTIKAAHQNLSDIRKPFADLATDGLDKIADRLRTVVAEVKPQLDAEHAKRMDAVLPAAIQSLEEFRGWLLEQKNLKQETFIGRDNYIYFLRQVALVPYTPEEMVLMARQELDRSIAFMVYEQARDNNAPLPSIFHTIEEQIQREASDENAIRAYMGAHHILTVPDWMMHYRNLPLPAYLRPLHAMGPSDDLTGPGRLNVNGTSYITPPRQDSVGFFATSRDPRPIILHEGVPGHYFQEVLGAANANPIRRHYYDSGPNEGVGFYSKEMMMMAGLFDNDPGTRQIIYSFMRLRALRVEVDVKLALNEFTLAQGIQYLTDTAPMSHNAAVGEAALFATTPGQAITYQIGKLQIMKMISDATRTQGSKFSLQQFHDFIWNNGNVPFSLQRWELLDDRSEVPALNLR